MNYVCIAPGRPGNRLPETATSIVVSTGGLVAVVVGTTVQLTCKSNGTNSFSWVFYPPNSFQAVNVFIGNKLGENFSQKIAIDSSLGQSTLSFAKVKPVDRGRYECLEESSTNDGVLFDLNVYSEYIYIHAPFIKWIGPQIISDWKSDSLFWHLFSPSGYVNFVSRLDLDRWFNWPSNLRLIAQSHAFSFDFIFVSFHIFNKLWVSCQT